jgi:outer membrane protein OmpA-like peptidoglycan-associated protein
MVLRAWSILVVSLIFVLNGCATDSHGRAKKGALIGAIGGAAAGAAVGSTRGSAGKGALIGGVAGALIGGVVGNYMDRQAEELERVAEVERTGEGLVVTMRDKILFDFDSASLKPESETTLQKVSDVLKKYDKTTITVAGYTDNVGSSSYNYQLSEKRAKAVKFYLVNHGVASNRIEEMGFGKDNPVVSNETPEGRSQNRRVELHVVPNDELRAEGG